MRRFWSATDIDVGLCGAPAFERLCVGHCLAFIIGCRAFRSCVQSLRYALDQLGLAEIMRVGEQSRLATAGAIYAVLWLPSIVIASFCH